MLPVVPRAWLILAVHFPTAHLFPITDTWDKGTVGSARTGAGGSIPVVHREGMPGFLMREELAELVVFFLYELVSELSPGC